VDLLLVFDDLPASRYERFEFIYALERQEDPEIRRLATLGYQVTLSSVLKTKTEFSRFSSFYLDFVDRARILFDPEDIARLLIEKIARWIEASGAYRVQKGLKWYWVLRPGAKPEEEFTIGFDDALAPSGSGAANQAPIR
jgi:hypothetical protein